MNFYTVIIGTELLNGRRKDAHFEFVNAELLKRGWDQFASFIITDKPSFIEEIFKLIKNDKDSVMFCFGGIGSTPDDYTRECAANIFTDGKMEIHQEAKRLIIDKFGDEAYPHRINMANLPIGADLLKNVVNQVPGFSIENRFFFTPGFPNMAHSMVIEALEKFYPKGNKKYRRTLLANVSENELIPIMNNMDQDVEMSSLPMMKTIGNKVERTTEISVASYNKELMDRNFKKFVKFLEDEKIYFKELEIK